MESPSSVPRVPVWDLRPLVSRWTRLQHGASGWYPVARHTEGARIELKLLGVFTLRSVLFHRQALDQIPNLLLDR